MGIAEKREQGFHLVSGEDKSDNPDNVVSMADHMSITQQAEASLRRKGATIITDEMLTNEALVMGLVDFMD